MTFITFEGINGAGKSTMIAALHSYIELSMPDCALYVTKQPGGSSLGEFVRSVAFRQDLPRDVGSLLIQADRLLHVAKEIKPRLDRGEIVICDRYVDSTTAYQVYGCGWGIQFTHTINEMATCGVMPDLTFLLDIDPALGLSRDKRSSRYFDDSEQITKLNAIRSGYLELAAREPNRWCVLDAGMHKSGVFYNIVTTACKHLKDFKYDQSALTRIEYKLSRPGICGDADEDPGLD